MKTINVDELKERVLELNIDYYPIHRFLKLIDELSEKENDKEEIHPFKPAIKGDGTEKYG